MTDASNTPDRRSFLKTMGAAAIALGADAAPRTPLAAAQAKPSVRLGLDMFSVGAQQWTPFEQMDFAAKTLENIMARSKFISIITFFIYLIIKVI
jgi:hypothetical protein